MLFVLFFFFKQKTAYEMRIRDWSSDVCSSDLRPPCPSISRAHDGSDPAMSHDHSHGHSHTPASFDRAFAIGIALNLGFVAIEAGYGFVADSVALLADAGHNLSDVLGLALAWGGATLAKAPPSKRFTYGLRGSSILAALGNAVLLLVPPRPLVLEAVQRLGDPPPLTRLTVPTVARPALPANSAPPRPFPRRPHGPPPPP